jgi:hypothetical protein
VLVPLAFWSSTTARADDFEPILDGTTTVFVQPGITDDFDVARKAIEDAKSTSGRRYRAVIARSTGGDGGAPAMLPRIVDGWWEARDPARFDPSSDITIVLDLGDRSIALDVPPSLLTKSGLDMRALERDVITKEFVPKAKDMRYADGVAAMVAATDRVITACLADRARRDRNATIFRTRTLPIAGASLVAAGILGAFAVQRWRHVARMTSASDALAAFKRDVVALSDLLDASQERHRMLPHTDPDFLTPMRGMTRDAYDAVQDAIRRYRERWLALMETWDKAQERLEQEWFLGTDASDDVVAMLASAEARPPLDEVRAACQVPLDALETSHETARALAEGLDADLAAARSRLDALSRRGRSTAPFDATVAEATRAGALASEDVEPDPVAARGRLEAGRARLDSMTAAVESIEATDDRRLHALERASDVRARAAARRAEGWLLAEPGAEPEPLLDKADSDADLAARLLDAGDIEGASQRLEEAEEATANAMTLIESIAAARARLEQSLPAVSARLDKIAAARSQGEKDRIELADRYAHAAWSDVADNMAKADDGLRHARQLLDEASAAGAVETQHYFRAVAALEESERQAAWSESLLAAITERRHELDTLAASLPARLRTSHDAVATLAGDLNRQQSDRPRAHERCREARRLLEVATELLQAAKPDPRQMDHVIQAIDTAVARGEELAAEDERLARQARADIDEADAAIRRAKAWYAEGVRADIRPAQIASDTAKRLLDQQRYEDAIRAAAEASQQARLAYATATAEADRRRQRREAEQRRRQMEEAFERTSRGAGPWVINLPTGPLTGPTPWRSSGTSSRPVRSPPTSGGSGSGWNRDIATGRW